MYTGQLSIFDFLPPPSELDTLPEDEMVQEVGRRLGIKFELVDWGTAHEYRCKVGKLALDIRYETYMTMDGLDGQRYIGVGYSFGTSGGGAPCDSVEAAVKNLSRAIERYGRAGKEQGHGWTDKHI